MMKAYEAYYDIKPITMADPHVCYNQDTGEFSIESKHHLDESKGDVDLGPVDYLYDQIVVMDVTDVSWLKDWTENQVLCIFDIAWKLQELANEND